jgi:hypothetical protein
LLSSLLILCAVIGGGTAIRASAEEEEEKIYYGAEISFPLLMPGESSTATFPLEPLVKVNVGSITAEPGVFTVPPAEDHCSGKANLTPPATCTVSVKYAPAVKGENVTGVLKIPIEESNAPHKKVQEWHLLKGHSW